MAKGDEAAKAARASARARRIKDEAKAKLKAAKAKGRENATAAKVRARTGGLAGAGALGLARRAWDRYGPAASFGKGLPHVEAIGEAGTYGLGMALAGGITGSEDLMNAGFGALDAQAYMSASGVKVVSDLAKQPADRRAEVLKARAEALAKGEKVPNIYAEQVQPAALPQAGPPPATARLEAEDLTRVAALDEDVNAQLQSALQELAGAVAVSGGDPDSYEG